MLLYFSRAHCMAPGNCELVEERFVCLVSHGPERLSLNFLRQGQELPLGTIFIQVLPRAWNPTFPGELSAENYFFVLAYIMVC